MNNKDINSENDVYFLGSSNEKKKSKFSKKWIFIGIGLLILVFIGVVFFFSENNRSTDYYYEPEKTVNAPALNDKINSSELRSYIETLEETVNDVPMFVYVPHNSRLSLQIGMPDKSDSSVVFVAQAADIRADNMEIVGDFVLNGKQIARGVAKKGFCAIIDAEITIGMADETPLLQKSIDENGCFFRQYPLVNNGNLIENNPKNKSIRRALAVRNNQIVMVESRSAESFHDFSQALIDIGVSDAVYLVGSTTYGWYRNQQRDFVEFGIEKENQPPNTNYIVWRTK